MNPLIDAVLSIDSGVRYVALRKGGEVWMRQRADLANASQSESDRYEELLVNPTVLTLASQRGNIDCGGLRYVVIRYGSFFLLAIPLRRDATEHLAVGFEPSAEPLQYLARIGDVLRAHAAFAESGLAAL